MYDLPHYKEHDAQIVDEFIAQYPFAFLTGSNAQHQPVATQLPMFVQEKNGKKILTGHLMKNTDHHKAFVQNPHVLAVFSGAHAYVSGTWYSNPHTASTWNYMSVQAKGSLKFLDDAALIDILRTTTLHFENNNPQSTTIYDKLPQDYTQKLIKAIVAFEIEVETMDTVFKLSQNRDAQSYENIIARLQKQGESGQTVANEMQKRMEQVFGKAKR